MHEDAYLCEVEMQSAAAHAAMIYVFLEEMHCDEGSQETCHHYENWSICH